MDKGETVVQALWILAKESCFVGPVGLMANLLNGLLCNATMHHPHKNVRTHIHGKGCSGATACAPMISSLFPLLYVY